MIDLNIRYQLDSLLDKLANEKSFDVAENVVSTILNLLAINSQPRFLANIPRVDAELSRFEIAPEFAKQAAAFRIPNDKSDIFEPHLYWVKKTSKTNLSWLIGVTPNFEDADANDYKPIGIDFVVPSGCDSVIVLLSNKYKIRSLELKGQLSHTQLEIFSEWKDIGLKNLSDKADIHARLWESFNFEPINRKFYLELVEHFSVLVHHLEKQYDRKPSVMFTTRLLGRILFIWFLKKKNLINQTMSYFDIDDPYEQGDYYRKKLEVLFFETLNKEVIERQSNDSVTPYLNGGLFDVAVTDFYNDNNLSFPNSFFNKLFETLNKYNFTVDESSPDFQQVAIDPEMLGRIFESLLAEQIDDDTGGIKRKATGAFYTPREIVNYMCERSIIEYLKSKIPDSADRDRRIEELVTLPETVFRDQDQNKRRDWKPYCEPILRALQGADDHSHLTVLDPAVGSGAFPMGMLHLLVKIYGRLDPKYEKNTALLKRNILANSLYGVDIEQTAIEICRLRAWLSIIVDESDGAKVEPLPNLDFKFACANTLIPLEDDSQGSLLTDNSLKDQLMEIRRDYFFTSNKSKKIKLQDQYEKLTHTVGLFDTQRTKQLKNYRPFDVGSSSEFYDPELIHGVNEFDVVIGNPPYVSVKKITPANKKLFSSLYETGKGRFNLFTLMLERGFSLVKKNGFLIYILPEGLFSNPEYRHSREYFSKHSTVLLGCLFSKRVFEAAVDTAVIMVGKNKTERPVKVYRDIDNYINEFSQKELCSPPNYLYPFMVNDVNKSIITKMNGITANKFIDCLEVQQGIIYSGQEKSEVFSNEKTSDVYKKVLDGRDISKYSINWNEKQDNKFIKYTDALHRPRNERIFLAPEKIVFPRKSTRLVCSVDRDQYYLLNTAYIALPKKPNLDLDYIAGLLNSKLIGFYYSCLYFGWQITIPALNSLPLALPDSQTQKDVAEIVKSIQSTQSNSQTANINLLEKKLDDLIYKIYGLTPDEIKIVEDKMK